MYIKDERKMVLVGWLIGIAFAVSACIVMAPFVRAKNADLTDLGNRVGENPIDEREQPKNPEISQMATYDDYSAMPCEDPEAFQKWKETYEQETGEEVEIQQRKESGYAVSIAETYCEVSETETEAIQESVSPTSVAYSVNGETLNPELQAYLYQRLSDYQLEWFMPYAVMIAYQESKFNIYAENPNGLDKGLFQFRLPYYPGQDIFNPYEQIDIFCQQMANRSQYDVYEMISRHNVSDFGSYNEVYVGQVLAHEQNLRRVN